MTTKSSFEVLIDYAKKNGFAHETHRSEKKFIVSSGDRIHNTKYVAFEKGLLLFLAYDSFGTKASMSQTFSGVYRILPSKSDIDFSIFKRDWTDIIFRRKRKLLITKFANNNLTVISKDDLKKFDWIDTTFTNKFIQMSDIISPLEILIRFDHLGFLTNYSNKTIVGIETNQWISEPKEINLLLNHGEYLIDKLITNFT